MSVRTLLLPLLAAGLLLASAAPLPAQAPPIRSRPMGKLKPVDLNSTPKQELAFRLGISEGLAARIVAGRPYPTKARLLTEGIVSAEVYAAIKDRVVARQPPPPGAGGLPKGR